MIRFLIGVMLASVYGSVILGTNGYFSLSDSRKTLGHPFATGWMQSASMFCKYSSSFALLT
jgi:hypothetical protein